MIIHNYCIANNYLISLTLRKLGLTSLHLMYQMVEVTTNKPFTVCMHCRTCAMSLLLNASLLISIDVTLMLYKLCQSPKWRSILEVQYLYPHNLSTSLPDNWSNASAVLSYIKYNIAYINCFHPSDNGCVRTTCE